MTEAFGRPGPPARVALAAAAGLCAFAALAALQLHAGIATGRAEAAARLAANQPVLVARVGPLAAAAHSNFHEPAARTRARAELEKILAALETDQIELSNAAYADPEGAFAQRFADAEGPLLAFLADARALDVLAEQSASSAASRLRILSELDAPGLTADLHAVASAAAQEARALGSRAARLGLLSSALGALVCAGALLALRRSRVTAAASVPAGTASAWPAWAKPTRTAEPAPVPASPPAPPEHPIVRLRQVFPVEALPADAAPHAAAAPASQPEPAPAPEAVCAGRALVLVRRAADRRAVVEALEANHLHVEAVDTLDAARAAASERAFNIIALDPVSAMFAGRIKATGQNANALLAAVAGSAAEAKALKARGVGVAIRAPIAADDVRAALSFALKPAARARKAA